MRKFVSRPLLLLTAASFSLVLSACNATFRPIAPAEPGSESGTPVITWAQPAPITYPTPLGAAQLDATANVAGTFAYSPAAGTVLPTGTQMLTAIFTPTDTTDYSTATASVTIVVNAVVTISPVSTFNDRLAIADTWNNRVLLYNPPLSTDANAGSVLGQAELTLNLPDQGSWSSSPETLNGPWGLAVDFAGSLWVADLYDCRVVEFRPPFFNGMAASVVIGQTQFSLLFGWPGCFTNGASGMMGPDSIAFDSQGNLWVSDRFAGRVTEYVPPFANGMAALISIGQASLGDQYECDGQAFFGGPGASWSPNPPTAETLCEPAGIAFDGKGNLWIADAGNDRVLEFAPPFSTGMAASLELGEPDAAAFAGASCASASASCMAPTALTFDSKGNLWVSDTRGNRVLEFIPPFTNGMAASHVLGQPSLTSTGLQPTGANTLYSPQGLSFDKSDNLFVSDGDSRVLIFAPPFSDGMNATVAIGQPDMTGALPNQTSAGKGESCGPPAANTLCLPIGVSMF